jgi:hypothetical protein
MKRKLIVTMIAIALLAGGTAVAAPATLQVSLSITPDTTLPGLSVPLAIRVRNGARALVLAPSVRVRATSPIGETFFAIWGDRLTGGELEFGLTDEEDTRFILPAKATVELEVPALDLSRHSWALDHRLLALPGEWTLEVLLYEDQDYATEDPEPAGISNPVKLTIETPTGRDVPIWEAIRGRGGEFGMGISEKVLAEQPESRYFPYLSTIISRYAVLDRVAIVSRAIELHPNSPVVPRLRYAMALGYRMEADRIFDEEGDVEKATALADKGRAELTRLKNSKSAWSRLIGHRKLCCKYVSREYFLELQRLKARNREKATQKP